MEHGRTQDGCDAKQEEAITSALHGEQAAPATQRATLGVGISHYTLREMIALAEANVHRLTDESRDAERERDMLARRLGAAQDKVDRLNQVKDRAGANLRALLTARA